ncbi:VOC family protein [Defluviimonas sp. WL0002]|uniref:VOC family protein n=1 Tax=Albidovulum marisflavi TaxID=2984159 RepID=A0ABT2ZDB4_9RHOB|nr:VOC family protein [Defluviimonas sp. WL0002]MCV2869112.1 VOC family protein [Defluviimonas sp. WL0002]
MTAKVRTCLWFNGNGLDAARFYVSLISDSHIDRTFAPRPDEPPLIVDFTLAGTPYQALNGGPQFTHSEAASISVLTRDQAETDRLWDALTADGGTESQCGWLKDRFGVSWQIVPEALPELLSGHDQATVARTFEALMGMRKIEISALFEAADVA